MSAKKKSDSAGRSIHITNGVYIERAKIEGGFHFYPRDRGEFAALFPQMRELVRQSQVEPALQAEIEEKIKAAEQEAAKPEPEKEEVSKRLKDLQTVVTTAAAALGAVDAIPKLIKLVEDALVWAQNNIH